MWRTASASRRRQITAKEAEIAAKEAEIADQWDGFKQHMAAMQELRDGGKRGHAGLGERPVRAADVQ